VKDAKIEALRRVPLFSRCSKSELQFLASEMDQVSLPAGHTLISEGRPGHTFYIILSGEVDVYVEGRARRRMGAGDFFGEISMLDRGPATATVVTTTAVETMVLSHTQFRDAIRGNEAIAVKVLEAMAERLRADALRLP
jgi:CRP-like cAMP-binding protein